jgi:hypothetical protein
MGDILSWLALIFLTLAGYSAGAVIGFRTNTRMVKGEPSPSLLDTMMVIVLWIGGIASRLIGVKAWSTVGIWLVIALAVAFILNRVQPQPSEGKPLPQ